MARLEALLFAAGQVRRDGTVFTEEALQHLAAAQPEKFEYREGALYLVYEAASMAEMRRYVNSMRTKLER